MPKLTLDLDNLQVESFSTGSESALERLGPTTTRTQEPGCTSPTLCNGTQC